MENHRFSPVNPLFLCWIFIPKSVQLRHRSHLPGPRICAPVNRGKDLLPGLETEQGGDKDHLKCNGCTRPGKPTKNDGKIHHFFGLGKLTISTGPCSSSQTVKLPEGMTSDRLHKMIHFMDSWLLHKQ